jgi:arylsulfatase A-like enzyme
MKRLQWLAIGIVAALACGYIFRTELALQGIGLMANLGSDIGPHREIEWSSGSVAKTDQSRPNIVLIVADDMGWNDITLNGGVAGGTVPTPNIDAIAAEGATFNNGYAAHGTCAPSRAALMSGRYPTRFGFAFTPTPPGMLRMVTMLSGSEEAARPPVLTSFEESAGESLPYEEMGMPASEVSLAETLKGAGYHTAHIGKWHLGRDNGMAPHDQGFDESLLMASGLYLPEDDPNVVNSKQDFDPIDRFLWKALRFAASFNGGSEFEPGAYLTDYYTDEAIKVIEKNKDRPFFLYLAHWAPHTPLQATKEDYDALSHIELHRERVYAAMIRSLDRGIGRVMQALKDNGVDDNTLVIFTSDNGGAGYIGIDDVNAPFRGFKMQFFEGGIHVPFMMRWPTQIQAGIAIDDPVHHIDVFATSAAAGGAPLASNVDGVDLLPFLGEAPPEASAHEALFWLNGHYQVILQDGWKLQKADYPDKVWLFNMREDPTEQHNVAEQHPQKVQQLLSRLAEHVAEQPEPAWPSQINAPGMIDRHGALPWDPDGEYVYSVN